MAKDDKYKQFQEYLKKIQDIKDDKCCFCGKTPREIKEEFFQYKKQGAPGMDELSLEDIVIMTYKFEKPVCAGCYFSIKNDEKLVQEILKRPMDEIW